MQQASMLNLTRKWRAQTFDTLVGQELVVKILKNSLYVAHYFPVYLFSGQRGCGKTSTARIFAAALNCAQLAAFQTKPKEVSVPCGQCDSCIAMMQVRHPDFIEIDAASHTGVDNMRTIIDAAYYLPVLGRKKIYLIDEAHMLSKAAFNAMLKIFEEPPTHAHFILATTDPEKIIETVRSRCFSLFFGAIDANALTDHLKYLCAQESIGYTDEALDYIARSTEGSARDAINLLETVRFSHPSITLDGVLQLLGHVDDQQLAQLLVHVLRGDVSNFLATWSSEKVQRASAHHLWAGFVRLVRGMTWHRYGLVPADVQEGLMQTYFAHVVAKQSTQLLEALYQIEPLFIRSSNASVLLEFTLLQLCSRFKKNPDDSSYGQSGVVSVAEPKEEDIIIVDDDEDEEETDEESDEDESDDAASVVVVQEPPADTRFAVLRESGAQLNDPLLASIIAQVVSVTQSSEPNQLVLHFSVNHNFFAEMLNNGSALWQPIVATIYGHTGSITSVFDAPVVTQPPVEKKAVPAMASQRPMSRPAATTASQSEEKRQTPPATASYAKKFEARAPYPRRAVPVAEKSIDVSDIQRWPLTNRVLTHFPGTVTVVDEARL